MVTNIGLWKNAKLMKRQTQKESKVQRMLAKVSGIQT